MAYRKWLLKRYVLPCLLIFTTVFILSRWTSPAANSTRSHRHGRVELSPDRCGHGSTGPCSIDSVGTGTLQEENSHHVRKGTLHTSHERNQKLSGQVDEVNLRLIQPESVPRRIAGHESNVSELHHEKQAAAVRTQPKVDTKANKTTIQEPPPKKRKLVLKRKILRKVIRRSTGEVLSSKIIVQDMEKGEQKTYDETWYKDILAGHYKAKVVQVSNKTRDDVYMTEKLWKFDDPNSERLFLYNKLLNHDWKRNITNLRYLRRELREGSVNAHEYLAVSREIAPLNSTLTFYPTNTKYTVTERFRKNLPAVSPFRGKRYRKCAVIGNSGSLLNSSCGRDIDSADMVFRCNAAPIKPFVKDAGSKSNITTFNPSIFRKRFNDLRTRKDYLKFRQDITQYNGYLWLACFGGFSMHEICLIPMLSEEPRNPNEPEILVGHPDHYRNFWAFWERRKMIKTPSTGFFMTHVALQLCDETHLYGFWPFSVRLDTSFERVPYHYFDQVLVSQKHAMNQEFSIFSQYHELGIVRLHTGKCLP